MPPKNKVKQGTKRLHNEIQDEETSSPPRNERRKSVRVCHEVQSVTDDCDEVVPSSQAVVDAVTAIDKQEIISDPAFVAEFSENLKKDQQRAHEQSSILFRSCVDEETAFRKALNAQVSAALTSVRRSDQTSEAQQPKGILTGQPLWDDTKKVLQICHALKGRYQEVCQAVSQMKSNEGVREQWQADHDRLADELDMGYRVAERQIARVIGRQRGIEDRVNNGSEEAMEDARVAQVLQMKVPEHAVGVNGEVSISETMRYVESGLRRLTRGLPVTETIEE